MNTTKANRRTMDFIHHMRRSAVSAGRPGGLITEITWKEGHLEVICEWWNRQTILSKKVIFLQHTPMHIKPFFSRIMPKRNKIDKSEK